MTIGSATVVVLGDIGHSPRTCYHAYSLAERDIHVDLVGYKGSIPHEKIRSHKNINLVYIPSPPKFHWGCLPGPIQLLFKFIFMSFALLWGLLFKCRWCTSLIVLQNPPGIPTMLVCYAISVLKRAALATDWHNYTHTILAHNFPKRTSCSFRRRLEDCFVNWAHNWEGFFGRRSNISVCVSNAMREDLKKRWGINALTLHDKPPMWNFITVNTEQKHDLFYRLFTSGAFEGCFTDLDDADQYDEETIFTIKKSNKCSLRSNRPLLMVSSTSWTEDEDFGLLLDALVGYSKHTELTLASASACYLPKIFVVITGKGPQKQFYMDKIPALHLKNVEVVTAWLTPEDYPRLLASADIGVSLHTSSSGLDLPMKIVDMFGCGLPVLAKRFPAIDEQVQDGINGRLFDTANQLRSFIIEIAGEFVENKANLSLRKNLASSGRSDWHSQWEASLWPVLHKIFRKQIEANERWARFERHEEDEKEGEEHHVKGDDDMSRSIDTIVNDYDVLGNTDEDLDVQINADSETNSD